jgi:hypothetical protein
MKRGLSLVLGCVLAVVTAAPAARAQRDSAPSEHRLGSAHAHAASTYATHEAAIDPHVHRKVRRLRIAGWTSVVAAVGLFCTSFIWLWSSDGGSSDDAAGRQLVGMIGMGVSSALLVTMGGAMLLRARLVLRRHERRERDVGLAPPPTGRPAIGGAQLVLEGRF